ncbi:MAG: ribonuclease P protein component [gamma proteobacterium endosymbiont of Lamellibrachia anaximandri]|nr:ribonuclease P protein component [gamma proteobacterium endosymbiont of Lamellibrachia anaximandri]MBL3532266.1 ribonuclease P protein component [gamma proteobacterium endosymbiont of Lamellibrachia anaximandri]
MPAVQGSFPRRSRLLKPDEYRRVFSRAERSTDKLFLVLARENGLEYARLGLAISKKNTRRAVDRNRLKRLVRESFRQNQELLAGLDIVVLNRRGKLLVENGRYSASLFQHWKRLAEKCAIS